MRAERRATKIVVCVLAAVVALVTVVCLLLKKADPFLAVLEALFFGFSFWLYAWRREEHFWSDYLPVLPPMNDIGRFLKGIAKSAIGCVVVVMGTIFLGSVSSPGRFFLMAVLAAAAALIMQPLHFIPSPFVRGTRRVTAARAEALAEDLLEQGDEGIAFGNVMLPTKAENMLFIYFGSPRAGKTTLLEGQLRTFLRDIGKGKGGGTRLILADPKTENVSKMASLVKDAKILTLHPFDDPRASTDRVIRCCAYDIAADTTGMAEAMTIAQALLPTNPHSKEPFWNRSAQAVISHTLWALKLSAGENFVLADLVRVLQVPQAIRYLVKKFAETKSAKTFLVPGEAGQGILMTVASEISELEPVAWAWENHSHLLSLDDFVDGEAVLLLPNYPVAESALSAISRIVVTRIGQRILSPQHAARLRKKTYLVLDETNNIGAIPNLSRLMTQAPGMGGIPVLSVHSDGLLRQIYGDASASLRGQAANVVALRMNEPETADVVHRMFGKSEMMIGGSRIEEQVVHMSELQGLRWADSELGMEGFFQSPALGAAWHAEFPPDRMAEMRIPSDPNVPDFVPRPAGDFRPRQYTEKDMDRLGLPQEMLKHFIGNQQEQAKRSNSFRTKFKPLGKLESGE